MDNGAFVYGKEILNRYLETNNCRKTPERYAILEAVYDLEGRFSMEQMSRHLGEKNFHVSRATLYNTMKLFQQLRLVVKHHIGGETTYEPVDNKRGHCHQICTECGKVVEVDIPSMVAAYNNVKLKRFRKENFIVYIYGICSSCQARMTKKGNAPTTKNLKRKTNG